jgi:hypothetical protein
MLHETLAPLRKSLYIPTVQLVRVSYRKDRQPVVEFSVEVMLTRPSRRARLFVPVLIFNNEPITPNHFRDCTGNIYALNVRAIRGLVTSHTEEHYDYPKRVSPVQPSWTDRTLLPTVPARSFFSLANRKQAGELKVNRQFTDEDGKVWTDSGVMSEIGKKEKRWLVAEDGVGDWAWEQDLSDGKWRQSGPASEEGQGELF